MAGYSGQEIALDVDTPSQLEQAAAQADLTKTQSQLAKETLPADVQYKQAMASNAQSTATQSALTTERQTAEWALRKRMADEMAQQRQSVSSALAQAPQAESQQTGSPLSSVDSPAPPAAAPTTAPLFDPQVDAVMHGFDSSDPQASAKADAQLTALAKAGNPMAQQFVGKVNQQTLSGPNGWLAQIGANAVQKSTQAAKSPLAQGASVSSPLAAGQPGQAADPNGIPRAPTGQVVSPMTGQPSKALTDYAELFPDKAAAMIKQQGLLKYISTGDIGVLKRFDPEQYGKLVEAQKNLNEAQKTALATKSATMGSSAFAFLGVARQFGVNSDQARGAWTRAITDSANAGFMDPKTAAQRIAQGPDVGFATETYLKAMTVAEAMKATGIEEANVQRAKVNNPEPNYSYAGVDPTTGGAVFANSHPAPGQPIATVTGTQIGGKPGAGTATFEAKQAAWLAANPGDTRGALEFANGARSLTPEKVAIAARGAALREQQNAALLGQTVNVDNLTQQFQSEFSQAGAGPAPAAAPGAPGAPRTPAPAGQRTPQQNNVFTAFTAGKAAIPNAPSVKYDPNAKWGSAQKPYVPVSKADYDRLSKGEHFIAQDGTLRIKP